MKNTPAKVVLPAGEFTLSRSPEGKLVWKGSGAAELAQPEPSQVLEWDGCVDPQGDFHLVMHTASRHLIHCHTRDGRRWSRQSLARLDRDDVRLEDLLITATPQLSIVYLLAGASPDPVAVWYRQGAQGSWQGRRLELPRAGRLRRLAALAPHGQGPVLYAAYDEGKRGRFFRIPLEGGSAMELFSVPGPMDAPQVLLDSSGALHTLFLSQERVYADNYPLGEAGEAPCLFLRQGELLCAFRREGHWVASRLSGNGWEPFDLPADPTAPPVMEITAQGRQLTPPLLPVGAAPSSPVTPSDTMASPASLNQILHNQALLLSQLQQSFREMQQQLFAVSAQAKACSAQERVIAALKDRCTQLEAGMAALEEMMAK